MPFPLLPLLVGGGLLGGQNFFSGRDEAESNSFIDSVFQVDRTEQRKAQEAQRQREIFSRADINDPESLAQIGRETADIGPIDSALRMQQQQRAAKAKRNRELETDSIARRTRLEDAQLTRLRQLETDTATLDRADIADRNALRDSLSNQRNSLLAQFAERQVIAQQLDGLITSGTLQDAALTPKLIMAFVEPGKQVTEQEGRLISDAVGAGSQMINDWNAIMDEGWNETTRAKWAATVNRLVKPAMQQGIRQVNQFDERATAHGIDPRDISGLGINRQFPSQGEDFLRVGSSATALPGGLVHGRADPEAGKPNPANRLQRGPFRGN